MIAPGPYSFLQRDVHGDERGAGQPLSVSPPITRPGRGQPRWGGFGLVASASLHLVLLAGLFISPVGRSFGSTGPDMGTGMAVTLVAGFAAGGSKEEPDPKEPTEPETGDSEQRREVVPLMGAGRRAEEVPTEAKVQEASPQVPRLAMMRVDATSDAANTFEGPTGASDALGGDPTATSDLLAQIARCLPPDFRPNLSFSQLKLTIGPDGRLAAAPSMNSVLPMLSADGRLMADRIVQAALLCGPYAHPDAVGRVITLAADFSNVPASEVSPRLSFGHP